MLASQPEGNLLAAACTDGTVKLWNLDTKEELLPLVDLGSAPRNKRNIAKVMKAGNSCVNCVGFNPTGQKVLYGDDKGFVFLWSLDEEASLLASKRISEQGVVDVEAFGNERFLALVKESRLFLIEVVFGKVLASPVYTLPYSGTVLRITKCLFVFESRKILLFWPGQMSAYLLEIKKESNEELVRHLPGQDVMELVPNPINYPPFFFYCFAGKIWKLSVQSNESVAIRDVGNINGFFVQPMNLPSYLMMVAEKEVVVVELGKGDEVKIEGVQAVFAAGAFEAAENLVVLAEDRMTVHVYSIPSKSSRSFPVSLKIKRLFPSQNSYGITYETVHEHSIRLSKGFKTKSLTDTDLDSIFRLEYDESLATLEWHTKCEHLALSSNKRICILNPSLQLLKNYSLLTVPLSIYWFGSSLLVSTNQGVYYCGDSFKLLLNTFTPSIICAVIVDRIYLFSKGEVKAYPAMMTEPLIWGAVEAGVAKEVIEKLSLLLPCSSISSDLLLKLLKNGMQAAAGFLAEKTLVPLKTKLEIHKSMNGFEDLEKTLFRQKPLSDYQNLAQDIHLDHNWKLEKSLLSDVSSFLDSKGQFNQLSKILKLNKNHYELSLLHQSLNTKFPSNFDSLKFSDFSSNSFSKLLQSEPALKDLKTSEIKKLEEVKLGFGESAYSQQVNKKEILSAYSDNLSQLFGWDSLKPAEKIIPKFIDQEVKQEEEQETEVDLIYLYFRCDEGKGCLNDVMMNKTARINEDQWAGMLEEGEPLDYDDKWGKQATPSFRILLYKDSFVVLEDLELASVFSLEFWISINEESCNLAVMGSFLAQVDQKRIRVLNSMVCLENESGVEVKQIRTGTWEHVCFSFSKSKTAVFVNSVEIFTCKGIEVLDKNNLTIGGFSGHITEIRIWKSFRTQSQILENYKCPLEILSEKRKKKWVNLKINKTDAKPDKKPEIKLLKPDSGPKPELKPLQGPKKLAAPAFIAKFPKPAAVNPLESIFKLFDQKNFPSVIEEIDKLTENTSKEKTNLYKFVSKMLINIEKYKKSSRESKHFKAAACLNLLVKIKLNPEHRKIVAKEAIQMNVQIGNFGIASKMIYNLLDHCDDLESKELEELLAQCVSNDSADKATGFDEVFAQTQEYFSSKLNAYRE